MQLKPIPLDWRAGVLTLMLAALPVPVLACETTQIEAVLRAAYPQASQTDSERLILADGSLSIILPQVQCKRWPARPDLLLLAVPLWTALDVDRVSKGDLEVLVADADSATVRARYREPGRLDSDAWYFDGVSLDTARYQLTDTLRAFGVRVDFRGSSRVNPLHETSLTLYVLRGDTLQPMLPPLLVDAYGGEWNGHCAGEFAEFRRTVAIAPSQGPGWADLVVRSHASRWDARDVDGECVESRRKMPTTTARIEFDGEGYRIPANLVGWPHRFDK